METVRPVAPLEETSPGKAPVSPSKPRGPSLDSTVVHGEDPAPPSAPPPGLRELAQWLLLPESFTNPSQDLSERTTVWDSRPPHEALQDGGARLARTKQGRDLDVPPAAAIGEPPGVALVPVPPLLLLTLGFRTRVSLCLSPAFGLTAFDP